MNYIKEIQNYLTSIDIKYIDNIEYNNDEIKWIVILDNNKYTFIQNKNNLIMITLNETIYNYDNIINYLKNKLFDNIINNINLSNKNDYISNIQEFLTSINIDYSDYDDDLTYYDGYDDVWVVTLKNNKYKFVQNLENGNAIGFMMISNDIILYKYDKVINYLKNILLD